MIFFKIKIMIFISRYLIYSSIIDLAERVDEYCDRLFATAARDGHDIKRFVIYLKNNRFSQLH